MTTPQQHAEALEKALSFCRDDNLSYRFGEPNEYGTDCWEIDREELGLSELATVYSAERAALICAAVNAARPLLDERKRLLDERDELRAQVEALRADAERYRWLRSRKSLELRSASAQDTWTRIDGTTFIATHYLAECATQHAPAGSLDETIDGAIVVQRLRDAARSQESAR